MPEAARVEKARLMQIENGQEKAGTAITVQFNPESLRVTHYIQNWAGSTGNQTATERFKQADLGIKLIFDTTAQAGGDADVTTITKRMVDLFVKPVTDAGNQSLRPPPVRFVWGKFLFDGIVTAVTENLEFFAADGTPLRATVDLTISAERRPGK